MDSIITRKQRKVVILCVKKLKDMPKNMQKNMPKNMPKNVSKRIE